MDGKFKVTIKSFMGKKESIMDLTSKGNILDIHAEAMGMQFEFPGCKITGNTFHGITEANTPMGKSTMEIDGTVDGEKISGKLGSEKMSFSFQGEKLPDDYDPKDDIPTETRTAGNERVDVILTTAMEPMPTEGKVTPLKKGKHIVNGIIIEIDVPVKLRDGTTIYTDIYRPRGREKVPAIVAWSPYGKRDGSAAAGTAGITKTTISENTKLEGPDPDYWCRQGYALINPDPRGVGKSEGTLQYWSHQEAEDTADLINWVGELRWCNGRVGMAGNSWLAISQWKAAAEKPKHLACIAPWEGSDDVYQQILMRGGIPDTTFSTMFGMMLRGKNLTEDIVANMKEHPMEDAFWRNKLADVEKIDIPVYATAGWSHFHLPGSIRAFNRLKGEEKWLRIHREFEWPDQYAPDNLADLKLFFDRYLKGHHNGWEMTPRVRMDVMDRGDRDYAVRRKETAFPLPDTIYRKLYLNAQDGTMQDTLPQTESKVSYDAAMGEAVFDYTVNEDTELSGYFKLRVWVQAKGSEEMDLFIALQKADAMGNFIPTMVMGHPHVGAEGMLRVSHRKLNENSTEFYPQYDHLEKQPLKENEILPVDIAVWPTSRFWHKGEKLRVVISGHYVRDKKWVEPFDWDIQNKGEHIFYTGGKYDAYLLVPQIPALREVKAGSSITSVFAKGFEM